MSDEKLRSRALGEAVQLFISGKATTEATQRRDNSVLCKGIIAVAQHLESYVLGKPEGE